MTDRDTIAIDWKDAVDGVSGRQDQFVGRLSAEPDAAAVIEILAPAMAMTRAA